MSLLCRIIGHKFIVENRDHYSVQVYCTRCGLYLTSPLIEKATGDMLYNVIHGL